jgi:cytochrome b pre-mRNA-processing protein 3
VSDSRQTPASLLGRLRAGLADGRARRAAASALYLRLVAQARDPYLFESLAVPDTREGRLEAVLLHAMLVMRRLQREGEPGRRLAQALFNLMFADIDRHMREWGVGDLSVGKRVKAVAQSFYAQAGAAEPALAARDADALAPVLARNVYEADPGAPSRAGDLAAYLLAQAAWHAALPGAALLAGEATFRPYASEASAPRVATD